ncbi:MAG: mandelate racemase/muconate lactonizing enzyme family protein [Mycetocola sp.]
MTAAPGTTPVIAQISAEQRRIPLSRPWGADVTEISVIVVTVTASDGTTGHGFSWTPQIGGSAVAALIRDDLTPFLIGRPAVPEVWDDAWAQLHEAGGGGVTTIALAGVDLALWDLRARTAGTGIVDLLGRQHGRLPAYGSGVNLHYSQEELVAQTRRWVEAGFTAVKVKVGKPDLAEDVERIAAVREALGPDRLLRIDANQRWDLDTATRAITALAEYRLDWVEEPLRADDLLGYTELRRRSPARIALGENVHTLYRFREFLAAGAVDVVQPNIIRVGGITPFLRIAENARQQGVELAPHLLPELSTQIALTLPDACWIEDVEDAFFADLGALVQPTGVQISHGWASADPRPGLGFEFR